MWFKDHLQGKFDVYTKLQACVGTNSCDMVFNIAHEAIWKDSQDQEEKVIKYKHEQLENAKCVKHEYHIGDKVLLQCTDSTRDLEHKYDGLYRITEVHTNETVAKQKGRVAEECVNIRHTILYQQNSNLGSKCNMAVHRTYEITKP